MPVLEEAMTSRFYCFVRKSQNIIARKYGLSKQLDSRFHRLTPENCKASLSNIPWARVGNFWQSESIILCHFGRAFEEAAAILTAIECKYMLLFSIACRISMETNFPRKYNMLLLCRQSFIGGNKLQSWPELLGHKGNKPVKMTYFLPLPPPDAMLMSGMKHQNITS